VVDYAARHHERLRQESENFHEAFYSSSLPEFLLDQVNSHLNTLRTSTWFTRAGDFGIGEGLGLTRSFAGLSTIDVAMYGQILTTALFPTLDKEVMRSHARIQLESGIIAHSVSHNFRETKPAELSGVRLDLTSQFVVLSLRAAWFSADNGFLREIWPSVKSALDYSIRERDHNGDGLPDMEGIMCSYDNFPMYGVAPYVAIQWLAAVQAACFAAKELGDSIFLDRYERIFERGLEGLEAATWNGSYYRLYADGPKSDEGCLTDQVFGHLSTHLSGLPEFLNPDRVNGALSSILKNNFRPKQGLRNCQWPDDGFLHEVDADCWVDQANTCWTGVELAFASHLIYRGRWDEALEIVACVDRRYRHSGMYWDHQEFGGHYFRPMSAWGILHAALGYSNKSGVLRFDVKVPEPQGRIFFSTADGYGHFEWSESHRSITVLDGVIRASDVLIKSDPHLLWKAEDGAILDQSEDGFARLSPDALKQLSAGKSMRIEASLSNHSAEMRAT
jgi:uncharacterized protein (DUF608 family)